MLIPPSMVAAKMRTLEAKVLSAFLAAVALIVTVDALSWRSAVLLRDRADEDLHAQQVLTRLVSMLGALDGAVQAQRGHTITGDEAFLERLDQRAQESLREMTELKRMVAGDPTYGPALDRLDALVHQRLAAARSIVEIRRAQGPDAAQEATAADTGREIHDAIRELAAGIERDVERDLARSRAETTSALRRTQLSIAWASFVSLLAVTLAFLLVRRDVAARERTERALRGSEYRLRSLVTGTSDMVWGTGAEGEVTDDGPGWRTFTGQSSDAFRRDGWAAAVHPDDRAAAVAAWREAVASRSIHRSQYRVRRHDGAYRHVAVRGVPVVDTDGSVREWICAGVDTTDAKDAQEHIWRLSRLYKVLSGVNQLVVREHDTTALLEGACRIPVEVGGFRLAMIELADPATGRIAHAAHAAADGTAALLVSTLNGTDFGCVMMGMALATGERTHCDHARRCEPQGACCEICVGSGLALAGLPLVVDGATVGVYVLAASDRDAFDAAEVRLLDELATDISFALRNVRREAEHQEAVERMEESDARFRELAETVDEVFWATDVAKQRMLYVSPGYDRIWGRPRGALYESPTAWLESVHPEDRERVREATLTRQVSGQYEEEYRIVRSDGAVRWIRDRAFPVPSSDGRVERVVGSARDVTEQRELEAQLRQTQKLEAVGLLAGGVAHDFNNLLTVILTYAELLRPELADGLRADCDEITGAAWRARDLTQQLLAFSSRQALKPEPLDLHEVVGGVEKMLRRVIAENIRLVASMAPGLDPVLADHSQIEQVVMNLAINARDAMPDGGVLTLETRNLELAAPLSCEGGWVPPGSYVVLRVADTGVGMSAVTLARVFEPFFTTKGAGKGTGLGLATVHGIVRQSGGYIKVESELGAGTRFSIYLPRATEPARGPSGPTAPSSRVGAGERILLVEDEDAVRRAARRILGRAGYAVIEARTAEEAIAWAADPEASFDLLLTDVVLPGASGPDLWQILRAGRPALRVLFVSGYTPEDVGAIDPDDLVQKPFTADDLLRGIQQTLE